MTDNTTYLGDGAYARWEPWGDLVLYTSNGADITNTVVLDSSTLASLLAFINKTKECNEATFPTPP